MPKDLFPIPNSIEKRIARRKNQQKQKTVSKSLSNIATVLTKTNKKTKIKKPANTNDDMDDDPECCYWKFGLSKKIILMTGSVFNLCS